jgi:hypothetical protein
MNDRFIGEDGHTRHYRTAYRAHANYGGAIYLMVDTTGVHGGGIVRAVVAAGDPFAALDQFGYVDPNHVPAGAGARWRYGHVPGTRIFGWFPERVAGGGLPQAEPAG